MRDCNREVPDLRGSVGAQGLLRQGQHGKVLHPGKAQIADAVLLLVGDKHVLRLQVDAHEALVSGNRRRRTQVQSQIHRRQVGDDFLAEVPLQAPAVGAEQVHVVAYLAVHGEHLHPVKGQEALQFG